jgi:hypothetical protein
LPAGVAIVFVGAAALARPGTWHDGEVLKLVDWEFFFLVIKCLDHEWNQIVVSKGVSDLLKSDRDWGEVGFGRLRSLENVLDRKCSRSEVDLTDLTEGLVSFDDANRLILFELDLIAPLQSD